jgi:transposase
MPYIIEQKIKGNIYLYEVESYWDSDKKQPRQRRRYLGKKDEITGEAITPRKSNLPRQTLEFGCVYILHKITQDIGLEELLTKHFPDDAKQILLYAYFKICEAKAGYLFQEWSEDQFKPYQVPSISSQMLSRWVEFLEKMDQNRVSFFRDWTQYQQKGNALWFDLTSFSSYSEQNSWCEWGYNRDNELLPQVNLGMVMSMSGLPLFYQTYPGSISDVTTLKNIAFQVEDWGIILDTFIVDRGFYSTSNLMLLCHLNLHFIMPLPATVKLSQTLLTEVKASITSPLNSFLYQGKPMFAVCREFELNDRVFYATIYFDSKRFSDENSRFYKRLNELESSLIGSSFYTIEQAKEALESAWKGSSRFFHIKLLEGGCIQLTRKRNALTWRINRMGKMILISDKKYGVSELLDWYRKKDCVEKLFDTLKNELDERRIRVQSAERMQGKFFLNFIASIIYLALLNRMKISGLLKKMTVSEVIMTLRKWRAFQLHNNEYRFTEITKKIRTISEALDVQIPINPSY